MKTPTDSTDILSLKSIERMGLIFSAIAVIASVYLWPSLPVGGGVALGALLGLFNFRFLKRLVKKMTEASAGGGSMDWGFFFFLKVFALFGFSLFFIFVLKVNALAFVAGFFCMILAICCEGLRASLS